MSSYYSNRNDVSKPKKAKLLLEKMRVKSSVRAMFLWRCVLWLFLFSICFLSGLYGSKISVDLSWMLGEGWWIPLHVITVIPLVDVSRSFSQHNAEKAGLSFRKIIFLITTISLTVSLLSTLILELPLNICLAALVSVNIGGAIDLLVFSFVKNISERPSFRMLFSNLAATMIGGAVFFSIAYTELLPWFFGFFEYSFQNQTIMSNLVKGWISQSIFIWMSGILIAFLIENISEKTKGVRVRLKLI